MFKLNPQLLLRANEVQSPRQSYIQLCPWYLQSIKASPYPGSWAFKNWQMFLNAGRATVQYLLGGRTTMDLAARLDHLLIHEVGVRLIDSDLG